jgi:hypothetical protein
MSKSLASTGFGLSGQALAVLALLAEREPDMATYDQARHDYNIEIDTWPWYNGREKGVCLEVRPSVVHNAALLITFGEHRNSDDIFIDSWVHTGRFLNPPTPAVFTDEAYAARVTVPYGDVGKAVQIIRAKIKAFMDEASAPAPARILPNLGEDEPAPLISPITGRHYRPDLDLDDTFKVDPKARTSGTSLQGHFTASYKELEAAFGKPQYTGKRSPDSDGKVSTEWYFTESVAGAVATLYDYKETSLYGSGLPSVTAFRARPEHDWHIGARDKGTANSLIAFLARKLGRSGS